MAVKEISPFDFNESAFRVIGKDWLLITGEYEGKSNAMTASWGGLGIMWGKPVALASLDIASIIANVNAFVWWATYARCSFK